MPRPGTPALWFGLFGAHAMWSVQLLVSYGVAAHACYPGRVPLARPTSGGLWVAEGAVSLVALVVGAAALRVAYRSWRASGGEVGHGDALLDAGEGRARFMAFAGVLASALFLLAIVLNAAAIALTPPCW